jgi:hypothetical protein
MHARIIRALAGASLGLFLISCGDDSDGGGAGAPITTFPAALVETFGATGNVLVEYAGSAFDFNGSSVSLAPGATSAQKVSGDIARVLELVALRGGPRLSPAFLSSPTCTPTTTGAATDTDADGIPNEMTIEFTAANCTVTDTATGSDTVQRGLVRYRDTSDDLYGFDMDIDELHQSNYDGTTENWTHQTVVVHENARTTTSGGTWSLVIRSDLRAGTADTLEIAQRVNYDVKGTYTSNGAVPAGGPIPDGAISISGTIDATLQNWGRLVVSLVVTSPLQYESSCPAVDDGELELRLNGDTDQGVLVKYLDCGNYYWEFLGSGVL